MVQAVYTVQSHLNEAFPHISAANTYPGSSFRWSAKSSGGWWCWFWGNVHCFKLPGVCDLNPFCFQCLSTWPATTNAEARPRYRRNQWNQRHLWRCRGSRQGSHRSRVCPSTDKPTTGEQFIKITLNMNIGVPLQYNAPIFLLKFILETHSDWSFLLKSWKVKAWSGFMRLVR